MDVSQALGFWEENTTLHNIKCESSNSNDEHPPSKDETAQYSRCCNGNLNFTTIVCSEDDSEYGSTPYKKTKVSRQNPMSHRIIEKRRRDRMNNCLADLSRLIPPEYLKKGRGRIEKTEIIEMAIKYMKHLQQLHSDPTEDYRLGYQECMSEAMRFLVEVEGHFPREAICVRFLNHLQKHCEALSRAPPPPPVRDRQPSPDIFNDELPPQLPTVTIGAPVRMQARSTSPAKGGTESNHNNNNNQNSSESDIYEKHSDSNGPISYKYKNDIKLRFSQDLTAAKRTKTDDPPGIDRRSSVASMENHSLSTSSPPSGSEVLARRHVPSETGSRNPRSDDFQFRTGPIDSALNGNLPSADSRLLDGKTNFTVPIFVLHAKGSYYVPLTMDYFTLEPFLQHYNLLEVVSASENLVLHPVTINVSFQPNGGGGGGGGGGWN